MPAGRFRALEGIEGTRAYRTQIDVYGKPRTVIVSHSERFAAKQARSFAQTLLKARRELSELKGIVRAAATAWTTRPHRAHRRDPQAPLARRGRQGRFRPGRAAPHFRTDHAALQRVRRREFGKRIIFTDRHDWTDEQIVAAYRAQPETEGAFRQLKDPEFAAFSPAHHWTDQKLRVHAFYCTLALTIVNLIERELRNAGSTSAPSSPCACSPTSTRPP